MTSTGSTFTFFPVLLHFHKNLLLHITAHLSRWTAVLPLFLINKVLRGEPRTAFGLFPGLFRCYQHKCGTPGFLFSLLPTMLFLLETVGRPFVVVKLD